MPYIYGFFDDYEEYASTGALSAVDMSVGLDGTRAVVTGTGIFSWAKDGTAAVNGTTVLSSNYGQWVLVTEGYLLLNDSNVIDASQVQLTAADIALANGSVFIGNTSGLAQARTLSGDVTVSNTGVTAIGSGVIVNADVSATAAIDYSKLAALTNGSFLVGNGSNVATVVAPTGDVTFSNAGVFAIAAGAIVNADVNASAAIDFSKLATLSSANILVGSAGNVPTSVAVTGDVTISNTGVTAIGSGKVLLAMLGPNITPSAIVKYSGTQAYGGGAATTTITVAGLASTDLPFVQIQSSTNAVSIQKVTPTTNTITILLSGDPGAGTVFSYQALRAAA